MKKLFFLLIPLFLFASCEKEAKKYPVSYKVTVLSGNNPHYTVTYSSFNNVTQNEGQISKTMWISPKIDDREAGTTVSLKLEGGGGCSYQMFIYVNGTLYKQERMDDPYGPKTIEATLPN